MKPPSQTHGQTQDRTPPQRPAVRPELDPAFRQALTAEGTRRTQAFFRGIRAYRAHPSRRGDETAPILWQNGSTCLRDFGATVEAPIVLVIPSLINRLAILDLLPEQSFLRSLTRQGWRPLAVDWGVPGATEQAFDLDSYCQRLLAVLAQVLILSEQRPVHIVGYCMGGLLALALASLRPQHIRSLTLLATPWDFHQPPDRVTALRNLKDQLEPIIAGYGQLPVDTLQTLFAAFQPLHTLKKFAAFGTVDPASAAATRFVLLEDWLNDGVPLTAGVARDCLIRWYGDNRTAQNIWSVLDTPVDPTQLTMPSYIAIPGRDRIVPPSSARALYNAMPHAQLVQPAAGHIGLMASSSAPREIWQPWFEWLGRVA